MTKQWIVDPPSGWKYGFPKPFPEDIPFGEEERWFLEQGYPQILIDQGMLKHCRYWEEEYETP